MKNLWKHLERFHMMFSNLRIGKIIVNRMVVRVTTKKREVKYKVTSHMEVWTSSKKEAEFYKKLLDYQVAQMEKYERVPVRPGPYLKYENKKN